MQGTDHVLHYSYDRVHMIWCPARGRGTAIDAVSRASSGTWPSAPYGLELSFKGGKLGIGCHAQL